jgi:hypothetical protein
MELKHNTKLGQQFNCAVSKEEENFSLTHFDRHEKSPVVSFVFTTDNQPKGSVHLDREKVEELATTLLFWLDQTDPDKEAE